MTLPPPIVLEPLTARRYLLHALDLVAPHHPMGSAGAASVLRRLRAIQVDSIDRVGRNHDLVVQARADGTHPGDAFSLLPLHAFEYWCKERCLLPVEDWPGYHVITEEKGAWSESEREERLLKHRPTACEEVLALLAARGPSLGRDFDELGEMEPWSWGGSWTSSRKVASTALDLLWARRKVVIAGRQGAERVYDLPERTLPGGLASRPGLEGEEGRRWLLLTRVDQAGLLPEASGPMWGGLKQARAQGFHKKLAAEGALLRVTLPGEKRGWWGPQDLAERVRVAENSVSDDRVRILAPLDPLLWDRDLVRAVFGFDYLWEVYKKEKDRRFSYYAMPLLWRETLVGRIDLRRDTASRTLALEHLSVEDEGVWERGLAPPLAEALSRLLAYCRYQGVTAGRQQIPSPLQKSLKDQGIY